MVCLSCGTQPCLNFQALPLKFSVLESVPLLGYASLYWTVYNRQLKRSDWYKIKFNENKQVSHSRAGKREQEAALKSEGSGEAGTYQSSPESSRGVRSSPGGGACRAGAKGGFHLSDAHQRARPPSRGRRLGWAQIRTHLPHDGQLHGPPRVGSPVHQAGQEVSNESPCNCAQEQGECVVGGGVGGTQGHLPARPPQTGESCIHSVACLLAHSLICQGKGCPSSTWDAFFSVNGASGVILLASVWICPFTCSAPGEMQGLERVNWACSDLLHGSLLGTARPLPWSPEVLCREAHSAVVLPVTRRNCPSAVWCQESSSAADTHHAPQSYLALINKKCDYWASSSLFLVFVPNWFRTGVGSL